MTFDAVDGDFEQRIRTSFARQGLNETIGARLGQVIAGHVEIEVPFSIAVTQQHGFFHGSVMGSIGDSACGYAAMTLAPPDAEVLTIEYKINFLAPAQGERLLARGRVTKRGRTVTVCNADVFAVSSGKETLVATMLGTIMTIGVRRDVSSSEPAARGGTRVDQAMSPRWCPCYRLGKLKHRIRNRVTR